VPGDAQRQLLGRVGVDVGEDGGVGDRLNQSCAKNGSRDSENNVRVAALAGESISRGQEIELSDVAARGITAAGDDENVVDVAVGLSIAFLEACLADRAIRHNEPRYFVGRASEVSHIGQGIFRGARSAQSRLQMARGALVGVEARTETIVRAAGHDFDFRESILPILEERSFVRSKTLQRGAGSRRATAHAGVYGA